MSGVVDHLQAELTNVSSIDFSSGVEIGASATSIDSDSVVIGRNTQGDNKSVVIGHGAATGSGGSALQSVAIGYGAGNTSLQSQNVAIGSNSMGSLTSGYSNVAIGPNAMSSSVGSGDGNVAIGASAGIAVSGEQNVCIGRLAGSVASLGSDNVFLGNNANTNDASVQNAICIGNGASVSGSDAVAIGSGASAATGQVVLRANNNDMTITTSSSGPSIAEHMEFNDGVGVLGSMKVQSSIVPRTRCERLVKRININANAGDQAVFVLTFTKVTNYVKATPWIRFVAGVGSNNGTGRVQEYTVVLNWRPGVGTTATPGLLYDNLVVGEGANLYVTRTTNTATFYIPDYSETLQGFAFIEVIGGGPGWDFTLV